MQLENSLAQKVHDLSSLATRRRKLEMELVRTPLRVQQVSFFTCPWATGRELRPVMTTVLRF